MEGSRLLLGDVFALMTALLFAIGVIFFKKSVGAVPPVALNLFKSCLAFALLLTTAVVVVPHPGPFAMRGRDAVLIFVSGILGVGVSDTLFFMALTRLGASRTALVDCLYSPFVILLSLGMLEQKLPAVTALGGILILGSVIVSSRRAFGESIPLRQFWLGCIFGALSMITVAFAIVMVTPILGTYPLLWISTVRLSGGLFACVVALPFYSDRLSLYSVFRPQRAWIWMIGGTFFSTYLSLMTWLAGFKYSQAGAAALLNQTSTVFIVIFAAVFLGEKMTRTKLLAVAMAFAGAVVILYR